MLRFKRCGFAVASRRSLMRAAGIPQVSGGKVRSLTQRRQFHPGDHGIDDLVRSEIGKTAIRPCDNAVAADQTGETLDPLRDKFGVLHIAGASIDHARNENLVVR